MPLHISRETIIEDLVVACPDAITFLMEKGIRCLRCGEPIWGTLGEAMEEKDIPEQRQHDIIQELRQFLGVI